MALTSVPLLECNLSCFRNIICYALGMQVKVWLVRKHLSCLEMLLKDPVYKKLCTLT